MIWLHKSCIFGHSNFKRTKFNPFMISHRRFFWFHYNCCQYRHWMLEISQTILKFGQSVWRIMASDQFISRTSGPLVPISPVRFAVRNCGLIWFWNPDRIPDRAELRRFSVQNKKRSCPYRPLIPAWFSYYVFLKELRQPYNQKCPQKIPVVHVYAFPINVLHNFLFVYKTYAIIT